MSAAVNLATNHSSPAPVRRVATKPTETPEFSWLVPEWRTQVFIDGPYLYSATRSLGGGDVDFKALHTLMRDNAPVTRLSYFTSIVGNGSADYSPIAPLVDWLSYNGYTVLARNAREITTADGRRRIVNGDIRPHLGAAMLEAAFRGGMEQVVLFAGADEYLPFVEAMKRNGTHVILVGAMPTNDVDARVPQISNDLRRTVDTMVDLSEIMPHITRAAPNR